MKVLIFQPESPPSSSDLGRTLNVPFELLIEVSTFRELIEVLRRNMLTRLIAVLNVGDINLLEKLELCKPLLERLQMFVVITEDAEVLSMAYRLGPRFVLGTTAHDMQLLSELMQHYL